MECNPMNLLILKNVSKSNKINKKW
jgi:hypothetical protein